MKKIMQMLSIVMLFSVGSVIDAGLLENTFNTAGNIVTGAVDTGVGAVEDVAEGDIVDMPGNTLRGAFDTGAGAVQDSANTVGDVFNGNERPVGHRRIVRSEPVEYSDNEQMGYDSISDQAQEDIE